MVPGDFNRDGKLDLLIMSEMAGNREGLEMDLFLAGPTGFSKSSSYVGGDIIFDIHFISGCSPHQARFCYQISTACRRRKRSNEDRFDRVLAIP